MQIAIDDFGTGYSSLSYLQRVPFDILKIDRAFVAALRHEDPQATLVRTIMDLGRTLGRTAIAEGIEEQTELDGLLALGCELGQGRTSGRPSPPRSSRSRSRSCRRATRVALRRWRAERHAVTSRRCGTAVRGRLEVRVGVRDEREGVLAVGGRVGGGVGAELHEDPAGVERVDAHAEPVVDLHDVVAVVEPALLAALDVVEVAGVERDVVHPRLEPEAGGDGRVEARPSGRRGAPRTRSARVTRPRPPRRWRRRRAWPTRPARRWGPPAPSPARSPSPPCRSGGSRPGR